MSKADLFTARWYLSTGKPVPSGGPLEALYDLLTPAIGPMTGVNPPATTSAPVAISPGEVTDKKLKVAIVIGHNSKAPGAWVLPPLNLSEFEFNTKVFESMQTLASGTSIELRKFNRIASSSGYASEVDACYRQVNDWNPDFCVEMHFNGGGGNFAMIIVAKGSHLSIAAGAAMLETMSAEIGTPLWTGGTPRGVSQLTRSDRGGRSVWAASCPTVLTEPFFGDHSGHAKRVAELGFTGMASIYMKGIIQSLKAIRKL